MTPKPARALAWVTFVIGILVSIAGNIGHAASDGMKPGEWAGAAFWPTALLLSVEILVRVRWQPEKRWTIARFTGLIVVSVVAAILSYLHLRSLLIFWDYGLFQGSIGPLAVDGLMLIAASALLSISKERPAEHGKTTAVLELVDETAQVFDAKATAETIPDAPAREEKPVAQVVKIEDTPAGLEYELTGIQEDVDGPELLPNPEPQPEKSKLHVVKSVTDDDAEQAALQAWLDSGRKLSSSQVAEIIGTSKSTAHRRMKTWERRIQR